MTRATSGKTSGPGSRESQDQGWGLTQKQMAELIGVSSHAVWCWESGKMKPSHKNLLELAYRCEVSTDWILGRDGVWRRSSSRRPMSPQLRNAISGPAHRGRGVESRNSSASSENDGGGSEAGE